MTKMNITLIIIFSLICKNVKLSVSNAIEFVNLKIC